MEEAARDAMRLSPADNVATALRAIAAGEEVRLGGRDRVPARDAIPLCHKIALRPIGAGEPVLKYGHPIGVATETVEIGRHVHVHNMRSDRAGAASPGRPAPSPEVCRHG